MNTTDDNTTATARTKRRWLGATVLAIAACAAGTSFAEGGHLLGGHRAHAANVAMDPAAMDAHIDKMVAQFAAGASADQQGRVAAIFKAAEADLRPAHTALHQAHTRVHTLMMAPVIDRVALEQLRIEQMQNMDVISKRILAAVEDAADVLTPEQRAAFASKLWAHVH